MQVLWPRRSMQVWQELLLRSWRFRDKKPLWHFATGINNPDRSAIARWIHGTKRTWYVPSWFRLYWWCDYGRLEYHSLYILWANSIANQSCWSSSSGYSLRCTQLHLKWSASPRLWVAQPTAHKWLDIFLVSFILGQLEQWEYSWWTVEWDSKHECIFLETWITGRISKCGRDSWPKCTWHYELGSSCWLWLYDRPRTTTISAVIRLRSIDVLPTAAMMPKVIDDVK